MSEIEKLNKAHQNNIQCHPTSGILIFQSSHHWQYSRCRRE